MYTHGPAARPVRSRSGSSGWVVASAGSRRAWGQGGGAGGGWDISFGGGCPVFPRACGSCRGLAGLTFLWPVVVCAAGGAEGGCFWFF